MFFVTFTTIGHVPIFNDADKLIIATECLLNVCEFKKVKLFAYVVMSTDIHLLVFCENGGSELSKLVTSIKGLIRKELVGDKRLWEYRFDDKVIRSDRMMRNAIEYIHNNPVKAELVELTIEYQFSSARIWEGQYTDSRVCTDLL